MGGARDLKNINDWFKSETGGKVEQTFSTPLPRAGGVSAGAAAYFKGKWVTRFSQSGQMEEFQRDGEGPARIPMMQQRNYPIKMGVDSDLGCTIAQVQMDQGVSVYYFLPDEVTRNMTLIEDSLTAEFVQDLSMTLHPVEAELMLPILKLSYSFDALPLLSDLGLSDWLSQTDLTKITAQPAKLSTFRQKVVMETAPEGSQYPNAGAAAASQAMGVAYRVDRPFLFLVRDEPSGALLFIGKVLNPQDLEKA
ncbi:pigment epithelium-derived factor [Denticeps clupeoides]|nr:pigment epithelium-derived factor [Denticeps clupeoides]